MKYLAIILTILILILLSDKAEAAGQWVSERTQTWHVAVSGVISYHESVEEVWAPLYPAPDVLMNPCSNRPIEVDPMTQTCLESLPNYDPSSMFLHQPQIGIFNRLTY